MTYEQLSPHLDIRIEEVHTTLDAMDRQTQTGHKGLDVLSRALVISNVAGQALLVEDAPGLGKTELAKNLAHTIEGGGERFGRAQGEPDILPSDIIGVHYVVDKDTKEFEFMPGPLFDTDIFLVDELNRFNTKTQAAFHQAIAEKGITFTVPRIIRPLSSDLFIIATQNPHEMGEGTFPVSKPMLDRMGSMVSVGVPTEELRRKVGLSYADQRGERPTPEVVTSMERLREIKNHVRGLPVTEQAIALASLVNNEVLGGRRKDVIVKAPGHRAMIASIDLARGLAALEGAGEAGISQMSRILPFTLPHRVEIDTDYEYQEAARSTFIADAISRSINEAKRVA